MNDVDPLDKAGPPHEDAYQSIVSPEPGVAEMVRDPVPHRESPVAVGATGLLFTVAVTGVLVAEAHPVVVFLASA